MTVVLVNFSGIDQKSMCFAKSKDIRGYSRRVWRPSRPAPIWRASSKWPLRWHGGSWWGLAPSVSPVWRRRLWRRSLRPIGAISGACCAAGE